VFERHKVSFVSVTQQFNTSTSMGRLMLNVLLSFAQFEREIISERTRDKIAATRRKGKWAGGMPMLGYDVGPVAHRQEPARQRSKVYRYYCCTNAQKRGWHVCPTPSVPAPEMERFVVEQIKEHRAGHRPAGRDAGRSRRQREEAIGKLESRSARWSANCIATTPTCASWPGRTTRRPTAWPTSRSASAPPNNAPRRSASRFSPSPASWWTPARWRGVLAVRAALGDAERPRAGPHPAPADRARGLRRPERDRRDHLPSRPGSRLWPTN
jgi:hypothetical protein